MANELYQLMGNTQLPADPGGATDMRQATGARSDVGQAPLGVVPTDYTVRSVYDSRPVQAIDANFPLYLTMTGTGETQTFTVTRNVPQGYVFVCRQIRVILEPSLITDFANDILFSPQARGADVIYNNALPVGTGTGNLPIDTFFVVDENQSFGGKIFSPTSFFVDGTQATFWFYGNLLLKTGRPALFEIANLASMGVNGADV